MKEIVFTASLEKPITLKSFLRGRNGVSQRLLARLKHTREGITCNGRPIRSIDTVRDGDVIVLRVEDSSFLEPNGSIDVPVVYESDSVVVFDKPGGVPVHPSAKHRSDTLGNLFAYLYPGLTFRPVNRLDKDTSGLVVAAKDSHAANHLHDGCRKVYIAAVEGVTDDAGTIDAPIARESESIIRRCVREDGRRAVTHYRKTAGNELFSLEEIRIETGRTHQIRVHFAHIGHPLAGDDLYGGSRQYISRQALHCAEMTFTEPLTGEEVTLRSELPEDIRSLFLEPCQNC